MTTETLRKHFFTVSYKKLEVEDYLEAVRFVLRKNPEDLHNSELKQLRNPSFSLIRFRPGYDIKDVTSLLEDVDEVIKDYIKPRRH